ncbi:MAG: transcriptional regulator, partial [Firmicutes bacterium]|nr:transcriptional regulator [Bacillota bacterium]
MVDNLKLDLDVYKEKKAPEITGSISIFATPDIAYTILPNVLNIFCKRYPNVNTIVKESDIFNVLEAIRDGNADLGLISMVKNLMEKNNVCNMISNEMYFEKLFVSDLFALVSSSSPLAAKKSISLKQVLKYPLVFYSTHTADCWVEIFKNYGNPNIYLKSNSSEVYLNTI